MKPSTLVVLTLPFLAQSQSHLRRITQKSTQNVDYTTNLFQGTDMKQKLMHANNSELWYTGQNGAKYFNPMGAQRAGEKGPLLLQDFRLIETLATFNRERIPERVVHARGAGAHGFFEATTDFAEKLSAAEVFKKGTRTSVTVRFSTSGGARGASDQLRDPRGFAIKLRTTQGILDWVFNNTPVFFLRDPAKFPLFVHTQKTDPATNFRDWNTFWSWPAQFPESLLQFLRVFTDLGTPYGFRHLDGWSGHTYRLVDNDGNWVYCRVFLSSDQGIKNFTASEAEKINGKSDTWATKDLYDAIQRGDYPSWTVGIATMTKEQAKNYRYDIEDLTKDWVDAEFHEVGRITLTQNPENFHAEMEQAHFSPSNMVPGWEPSNDPMLQSRLFSYPDAARYRLGVPVEDIPVNCPFTPVANFDRDGHLTSRGNQGSRKNFPADFIDPINIIDRPGSVPHDELLGTKVTHFLSQIDEDIDFEQPRIFYERLSRRDKDHLYSNIAGTLVNVDNRQVLKHLFENFGKVSEKLVGGIKTAYVAAQDKQKQQN